MQLRNDTGVVPYNNVDLSIEKVQDIQEIMAFGVMSTTAVVINEKGKVFGRIPNKKCDQNVHGRRKVSMDMIDCMGDMCPIPMIKIEKKLRSMKTGDELMVVSDHSCTLASIREKYIRHVFKIDEVMIGVWEIFLRK